MKVYIAFSSASYYPLGAQDTVSVRTNLEQAMVDARGAMQDEASVIEADLESGELAIVWWSNAHREDTTRRVLTRSESGRSWEAEP